jgi:hypothetical protein
MVRITFISDAAVETKLCDSTRNLAEHNLKFGQTRVLQVEDLMRSAFKKGFDRKNRRNTIGFDVSRSADFVGTEFASPEKAFSFALTHVNGVTGGGASGVNDLGGSGRLKIELTGDDGFSVTLYAHDCLLESVQLNNPLGICLNLSYQFNTGVINTTA